jgi:kinesin family protein 22
LFRIIEIEWSVKHNKEFVPSPKRPKKTRSKKKGKNASGSGLKVELAEPIVEGTADAPMDVDEEVQGSLGVKSYKGKRKNGTRFGSEATNRPDGDEAVETPLKKQRMNKDSGDEKWAPPAIAKQARLVAAAE